MKNAILLLVSIITLSACRTHQHAESINHTAESTRIIRDTVNLITHQRDTLIMRDSIAHSEKVVGDTVRIETTKWRTVNRVSIQRDTIWKWHTDTVTVASTNTKKETVTKKTIELPFLIILLIFAFVVAVKVYVTKKLTS